RLLVALHRLDFATSDRAPDSDDRIGAARGQPFAVRTESNRADLAAVFAFKGSQFASGVNIPDPDCSIPASRNQELAIRAERNRVNGCEVAAHRMQRNAAFDFPDLDAFIQKSARY